ncbi:beta-lactamase hydrolase domain-containing protein [Cribrihabitans neustonicus]|uniref:beta-lactamase hydrolase domain-containing protein n=1 Tax=Cribrihabitans neustonicus TaxID=1429085 RepID=UPI003B58F5DD
MDEIATIGSNHIVALFAPGEDALRKAASSGMASLVDFRTEGEKGLSFEKERQVAETLGVNYFHFPVAAEALSDELVDEFRRSLDDLPQPVFLHCASGRRAGAMTLMALAADKGWDGDTAIAEGRKRGIDLGEEAIGQFVKKYADRKSGG